FLLRYLHVNPEENALTVFGPRQLAQKVRQDLAKIDRPLPQVEIEAVVVEFASGRDVEAALGLHTWGRYGTLASDSGSGDIRYDSLGVLPKGFEAALASMEQAGRVRIRARPRAVALNGETAALFVGQQKIVKVVRYDRGRDAYMTRVIGVDVGVKISITPWTGGNGEITARIEPVVSNIAELERASGLPVLSTRQAETTVRVKNGETVAIGGLTLAQNEPRSQKIPILGDLPLIGKLFRSSKPSRKTTETIFFITARTVGE
ncbi:MAG: type II and III secretion system protein, partial [Armatimonadetes bacterium]|nr:type II and III secretion system protein [Armatimonadota bacterium]